MVWVDPTDGFVDPRDDSPDRHPESVEDLRLVPVSEGSSRKLKFGSSLSSDDFAALTDLLTSNLDIFTCSLADIPGMDPTFICHKLLVNPEAAPIAQRKRKMGEEKRKEIQEETDKLRQAGFIREIEYPTWLANVVMVRKPKNKWRMCTDYTDLNKHCPKDSYPLPNIDRLVDSVSGYPMLSFMDAYSSYNQIPMFEEDKDKIAFMIDWASYCYWIMPLGLNNAGATYQRLVDEVF